MGINSDHFDTYYAGFRRNDSYSSALASRFLQLNVNSNADIQSLAHFEAVLFTSAIVYYVATAIWLTIPTQRARYIRSLSVIRLSLLKR